jgi:hypothetical protein
MLQRAFFSLTVGQIWALALEMACSGLLLVALATSTTTTFTKKTDLGLERCVLGAELGNGIILVVMSTTETHEKKGKQA